MARIEIRDYRPDDLPEVAALLAARHARDSARLPLQRPDLAEPEVAAAIIASESTERSDFVVASEGGRLTGFVRGERMLLPPAQMDSQYVEPHSILISTLGHALAPDIDATGTVMAMYRRLSERWVRQGYFVHGMFTPAGDAAVTEAWHNVGFGRKMVAAARGTHEVANVRAEPVIRRATMDDFETVCHFAALIDYHETLPPMFHPYPHETRQPLDDFQREILANPNFPHFLAFVDDEPVGMQSFMTPGFIPTQVVQEKTVYLYQGAVSETVRGGGVGKALLDHSMRWARESGYERCVLHFASGNWSGGPFWTGQGFVSIEHHLIRRIDPRIAWAR